VRELLIVSFFFSLLFLFLGEKNPPCPTARHNTSAAARPGHSQGVVGHDAAPSETSPADGLGSRDLEEDIKVSSRGRVGDGDAVRNLLGADPLRVAHILVAVLGCRCPSLRLYGRCYRYIGERESRSCDLEKTHFFAAVKEVT